MTNTDFNFNSAPIPPGYDIPTPPPAPTTNPSPPAAPPPGAAGATPAPAPSINPSQPKPPPQPLPNPLASVTPTPPSLTPQFPPAVFRPPSPNRDPAELGSPWHPIEKAKTYPGVAPGPDMPAPHEAYPAINQASGRLARWGSQPVASLAAQTSALGAALSPILDIFTRGSFTPAFISANRAQVERQMGILKIQQEQYLMRAEQTQEAHREELLNYGRIFKEAQLGAISPEEAQRRIEDHAMQTQHDTLREIIANKGLKGAAEYLKWEDAEYRALYAGTTALRKATGKTDADDEAAWSDDGAAAAGGAGGGTGFNMPGLPGAGDEDATPTKVSDTEDEGEPESDFDKTLDKQFGMANSQKQKEAVHAILNGRPDEDYTALDKHSAVKRNIDQAVAHGRHLIDQALDGPGDTNEKLDRVAQYSPHDASLLKGMLDLHLDPDKDLPATKGERERLIAQAMRLNPNWKTSSFALAKQYEETNKPAVRTITRVSAFVNAVNGLNSSLLNVPEDQKIPKNVIDKIVANTWTGDPAYADIYTGIQNVLNETSAIQSGTGASRVTNVAARAREMLNTMSPAQIRTQLLRDAQANYGMIRSIEDQYKRTVGDPNAQLPFFSPQVEKDYRAISRMNPYTGEMPEDASGSVRATSKKLTSKPSWLITDPNAPGYNAWKPLTEAQVVEGRRQLRALLTSTNPVDQAKAQYIRRRLGEFATAQLGDPDYDEQERPVAAAPVGR